MAVAQRNAAEQNTPAARLKGLVFTIASLILIVDALKPAFHFPSRKITYRSVHFNPKQ
jgi:hypothetical protein